MSYLRRISQIVKKVYPVKETPLDRHALELMEALKEKE
jgi:hypothetical protein